MEAIKIPDFDTKKELFDFLVKNKESLIAQKKAITKHSDTISFKINCIDKNGDVIKENEAFVPESDKFKVRVIINTTNLMDSHSDVHLPGLWKKSLKENRMIMHLQEHQMAFDKIIADGKDLKAFTEDFTWEELGFDFEDKTQALVFESIIKKKRNELMFDQYSDGYVKNHSVGMRYVKLIMAINDEEYGAEFEAWEKYYPEVANKEAADEQGYFWVVKEAKIIEGSAVPLGSNWVTPTLENDLKEPPQGTQKTIEPSLDTHKTFYLTLLKY